MGKNRSKQFLSILLAFILVFSGFASFIPTVGFANDGSSTEEGEIPADTLRIHYQRTDDNYKNLGLWLWGEVAAPSENWPTGGTAFNEANKTDYGIYIDVPLKKGAKNVNFLVLNTSSGDKDGGDKAVELFVPELKEVWIQQGSDEVLLYEPVELPKDTIRIHYEREDGNYDSWGLWNWSDVANPSDGWPNGALDASGIGKYGAYYDLSLKEAAERIGFLFVNKAGGGQSPDYNYNSITQNQIFIKDGDSKVYDNPYGAVPTVLLGAEQISNEKLELSFSRTDELTEQSLLEGLTVKDKNKKEATITSVKVLDDLRVEVTGDFSAETAPYTISYGNNSITSLSGWRFIDEEFAYDGELGAKLHPNGSATLKLWSPKADKVEAILYDKKDQNKVIGNFEMTLGDRGVWSIKLDRKLTGLKSTKGYFYQYKITHGDDVKIALDPYAKSMAAWKNPDDLTTAKPEEKYGKAAIIDVSKIGPKLKYAEIPGFEKREDTIIYEAHVRDFTSDPTINKELKAQFGTFAAFAEKLDYIEDLGVTHIQLLPVMSYYFGDELKNDERMLEYESTNTNYNWGYDPHSYFSLSGMYSQDPTNPEKRIEEFKRLINEIHKRGMGVVLDVVYNHTAQVGIFEDLVPNYYHFMDADGTPRTSFGGGRLGTTHAMSRKVLVDSIKYWVDEFKVDGFRFDMMGDHDAESIQVAFDEAKKLNPNIVMIGEGWVTFAGDEGKPVQAADQQWMQYTEAVGSFSDEIRNELKSGFGSEGQPRFLTNGARNVQQIFENIKGQPRNFLADQPGDVVQYIEAHDNLTLYDVIAQSIKNDPAKQDKEIHQRIRLGNSIILTSQGTAFLHAGQEFGRTKQFLAETTEAPYKSTYMTDENGEPFENPYFIHDSYDSSDIINRLDWQKATNKKLYPENNLTREFTTGLIKLRRSTDAFRLGSKELVDKNVNLLTGPELKEQDLFVAYSNEATNGDKYYVFVNTDMNKRTLTFNQDVTAGTVLVDSDEAGVKEVKKKSGFTLNNKSITLDPLTTVVIKVENDKEYSGKSGDAPGRQKGKN
ncbi:pullulanase [Mangrovibacillus cuniculi]|uniref:pullulanase n=1 Tax=Mangrovibacillus cuniculi TaxID=2593652 RepID=A0A7S8CD57_9BACI|nr:pullulanase [Mangrovibacillus cuniculi]QPC47608.1 pullulanase [Mangrovibacillus cuniculi]